MAEEAVMDAVGGAPPRRKRKPLGHEFPFRPEVQGKKRRLYSRLEYRLETGEMTTPLTCIENLDANQQVALRKTEEERVAGKGMVGKGTVAQYWTHWRQLEGFALQNHPVRSS